jgi:hypothetical protein
MGGLQPAGRRERDRCLDLRLVLLPDNQYGYGMLKALAHGLGVGTAAAGDSVKVMERT